jgi:hypothetical protein
VMILKRDCEMQGDMVIFKPTKCAIDQPPVREHLEKFKPHLLPAKFEESLADRAFLGPKLNATAVSELYKQVGSVEQLDAIARSYGRRNAFDSKSIGRTPEDNNGSNGSGERKVDPKRNAWADNSPNGEARRIAAIRSLGTKVCAGLARAAGKDLAGRPLRA